MSKTFLHISAILALTIITISLVDAKQYHLVYEKKTWADAREDCRNSKGYLASITSRDENKAALRVVALGGLNADDVWIGGSDLFTEGKFIWDSTGDAFDYADWADEPVKDDTKNCVALAAQGGAYYSWEDADCTVAKYFLCES